MFGQGFVLSSTLRAQTEGKVSAEALYPSPEKVKGREFKELLKNSIGRAECPSG